MVQMYRKRSKYLESLCPFCADGETKGHGGRRQSTMQGAESRAAGHKPLRTQLCNLTHIQSAHPHSPWSYFRGVSTAQEKEKMVIHAFYENRDYFMMQLSILPQISDSSPHILFCSESNVRVVSNEDIVISLAGM
jgi:hypothetical protein